MIQNLATTTTITTTTTSKETQRVHTHNQQAATYPTPIATDEKKPIIIRFSVPKKKKRLSFVVPRLDFLEVSDPIADSWLEHLAGRSM
jgi:hypothetical protein